MSQQDLANSLRRVPVGNGVTLDLNLMMDVRCGADLYAIEYSTVDTSGQLVRASGLLAVPTGRPGPFPMLSYQHGTETHRDEVPSNQDSFDGRILTGMAGACYIVVGADYLGLGVSRGFHPYLHASTEATTTADLIVAAISRLAGLNTQWNNQLFLAGYSQGGHVTMALHRHLESSALTYPQVTASAPMSGPYDLSNRSVTIALSEPNTSGTTSVYGAYLIYAMNRVYNIFSDLSSIMTPEVAGRLPSLFDGSKHFDEVLSLLPRSPSEFLSQDFLRTITRQKSTAFNNALKENDLYDWTPRAPVRMYYGTADLDVPGENATFTRDRMRARGASQVDVVNVGPLSHSQAFFPSIMAGMRWFATLRTN